MTRRVNVVWFKRDLRLSDHAPLSAATNSGPVLPLYIVEPELWNLPDSSRRHWHFIHDCLSQLKVDLMKRGSVLSIATGDALQIFEILLEKVGTFALWSHEETGNLWTYKRDLRVKEWRRLRSITWHELPTNGIVRRLKTRDEWSSIRDARMASQIIAAPVNIQQVESPFLQDIPSKDDPLFGSLYTGTVQSGGRYEAVRTLQSFLLERGRSYMQTISKPGISARHCSRLSAHLTYGTLSIREVEQATKAKIELLQNNPDPDSVFFQRNLQAFLSRLAWHCHFVQKLEQQPALEHSCMHPAFEDMRRPYMREDYFDAWKLGRTGYPLVDACMRSLKENGWITFRMRAMLVSFATYDLFLDWRLISPYLAQLFTDYEPGIHYSQLQMQSGVTGINAVRIYNPIKQSTDHDPYGKFIRRYIPELRDVPEMFIHQPWLMPTPPTLYPPPIVDHDIAIRIAKAEISKRWREEGFADQSAQIRQKLGSRSRPTRAKGVRKTVVKPTSTQRLLFED